ncbi:hypothetical protein EGW01_02345 [Helicobacter pylori]|uniref:Uncharacterized protein n=1 Tax=Helicobacter pylori TaxID=210 RepID=A0A3N5DDA8_HELPX|nr:hypothetical protein [Helicobacter pylori]RPF68775.1 hypothetical protein EGW01_02345 [Helicobacter pylori]
MKKELSAQNPQFSNNTLTIIEKLNNGVKISSNLDSRSKNFYSDRNFIDFKGASLYFGITLMLMRNVTPKALKI